MSDPDSILSQRAAPPVGGFPHARRAGDLLFLSGIGPRERGTTAIPGTTVGPDGQVAAYDFEIQCRAVFANVRAVLEDAGAAWEDIVDVTAFLTNLQVDFPAWNRLWSEYFPANPPARTTVEVTRLPTPIAIELKVVAWPGLSQRPASPPST